MDEIIYRQKDAPQPVTGRRLLLGAAGIVLRLAVAQIAVNALIALSGAGLFNVLFYLYAVAMLLGFMRRTVASSVIALKARSLVLQSLLGDSTTAVVEIPLEHVVAIRPFARCENLRLSYAQVTAFGDRCRTGLRVRAAFLASLISARLARAIAGASAQEEAGWAVVFSEEGRLRACVFCPDEGMLDALRARLPGAFMLDDRGTRAPVATIYARAVQRAFPEQHPHVDPLIHEEDLRWAKSEIERQKRERREKWQKRMDNCAVLRALSAFMRKKDAPKESDALKSPETPETPETDEAVEAVEVTGAAETAEGEAAQSARQEETAPPQAQDAPRSEGQTRRRRTEHRQERKTGDEVHDDSI